MIFIREAIPFVVITGLLKDNFECLWVEIRRPKCKRMTLCCSYRPGDQSIDNYISYLDDALVNIDMECSDFVLTGNINVDYSAKKNHLRRKLDEFELKQSFTHRFKTYSHH